MAFPPHLLDELARVFARVALDRLMEESAAREPRHERADGDSARELPQSADRDVADGDGDG